MRGRASRLFEATELIGQETLRVLGGSYKSWIENQVRLKAQLVKASTGLDSTTCTKR